MGFVLFFLAALITALSQLSTSFALANWTQQSLEEQQSDSFYPGLFVIAVAVYMSFAIIRSLVAFWIVLRSNTNMHHAIAYRVIRAKILFFDSNPVGRIVTRFAKDVAVIDLVLGPFVVFIAQGIFRTVTVMITVGIINYWLLIGIVISVFLMYLILQKGIATQQNAQKMDGMLRGPIHSTFAMVIQGLVTLRAFKRIEFFKYEFMNTLEKCANATFSFNTATRWVGIRLDMVCVFFSVLVTAIGFSQRGQISSELLIISI